MHVCIFGIIRDDSGDSIEIDICLYSAPAKAVAAERSHKKAMPALCGASLRKLIRIARS